MSKPISLTFGKYKGIPVNEIPEDYLIWAIRNLDKPIWLDIVAQELVTRGIGSRSPATKTHKARISVTHKGLTSVIELPSLLTATGVEPILPTTDIKQQVGPNAGTVLDLSTDVVWLGTEDTFTSLSGFEVVRRYGRRENSIFLAEQCRFTVENLFKSDLLIINPEMTQAIGLLLSEVAIYGEGVKQEWTKEGMQYTVQILYLGKVWLFQVDFGCYPMVLAVEEPST